MIATASSPTATPTPLWLVDGTRLVFNLHPGQTKAWDSDRRFVLMLAGTQSGKTSFSPLWLWREMVRKGPGDYLVVTSNFPLLDMKLLPAFRDLFENTLHIGHYHTTGTGLRLLDITPQGAARLWPDNPDRDKPARIIFGSATNPEQLESATALAAVLDEAGQKQFTQDSWFAILRRLSLAQGRVLLPTTPYNLGWLKVQVYDRWKAGDKNYDVVQFDSTVNPAFPREEYERARDTMPAWKFDLFYRGIFAKPAHLIYADYTDSYRSLGGSMVADFPVPPEWPRHVGIDFGPVNTAVVVLARDPMTSILYAVWEYHQSGRTVSQHVQALLAHLHGAEVVSWYGGAKSEEQSRIDWQMAGVPVLEPDVSDVESQIDKCVSQFKAKTLYVFESLMGMRSQLGSYSRKLDAAGEATDEIEDKASYHFLDAFRYGVHGVRHSRHYGPGGVRPVQSRSFMRMV